MSNVNVTVDVHPSKNSRPFIRPLKPPMDCHTLYFRGDDYPNGTHVCIFLSMEQLTELRLAIFEYVTTHS